MQYQLESPGLSARISPRRRLASMLCYERLCKRVLIAGTASAVIATTAFIFLTAHGAG